MPMVEEFEATGNWLFRKRSVLPVFGFALFLLSIPHYRLWPELQDQLWEILCLLVSFSGLAVRALVVGYTPKWTSGRNTQEGQIAQALNTKGMYSLVRHPLYLGNFLIGFGVSLFLRLWWMSLIYALVYALYYERIMFAEEKFLKGKFGADYLEWALRTPAFLPRWRLWQKPDLDFSIKKVLRKEYHGFLQIVLAIFALEIAADWYHSKVHFEILWAFILGFTLIAYLSVRSLHKFTDLLKTEGR